jgi:hypothetical protein
VTTQVEQQLELQFKMYRAMERPGKANEPPILEWWNAKKTKFHLWLIWQGDTSAFLQHLRLLNVSFPLQATTPLFLATI